MAYSIKAIAITIIMVIFLISGSQGELALSVSTGGSRGGSGYTETLETDINDQIAQSTLLSGSALSDTFSGSGSASKTYAVTNTKGDHAEVGYDIENSASYSGSYTLSPKKAKYAEATEILNVPYADKIHAFAYSNNRNGYVSSASIDVTSGSLIGYSNTAYADSKTAKTTQKVDSSDAMRIDSYNSAGNHVLHPVSAFSHINAQSLVGLDTSAIMSKKSAEMDLNAESASSSDGRLQLYSETDSDIGNNRLNAIATAGSFAGSMDVISIADYHAKTYADKKGVKATLDADASSRDVMNRLMTQGTIYDIPTGNSKLHSEGLFIVEDGSIDCYQGKTEVTPSKTETSQDVAYAAGRSISILSSARNMENSVSQTRTGISDGNIFLYSDNAKGNGNIWKNLFSPELESSADIKAVGAVIDVSSSALNPTQNKFSSFIRNENVKFAADIKSVVGQKVEVQPTVYSGLALMALRSSGAIYMGHVGVGVWNSDGTWTIGAVENPTGGWDVEPGDYNGGWSQPELNWKEVATTFHNLNYDQIKIIKVSGDTDPDQANIVMEGFEDRGYTLAPPGSISNTCLDASVAALQAYGAVVPDTWIFPSTMPNWYFGRLNGIGTPYYKWNGDIYAKK